MSRFVRFCTYAKFIGIIALPTLFIDAPVLRYFWWFFLLGFVEIFYNLPVFWQSLKQVWAMIWLPRKYGKNMPDKDNFRSEAEYRLPFDGAWAVVNGGVTPESSHSWSIHSQRYAYDFLIIGASGNTYEGDIKQAASYYCYGREILAPADGVVVSVLDGQPESYISGKGTPDCAARDICGNHILLQHAAHEYSLLAHLQPGSIKVKAGDRVEQGQVIACCGNSGNSTEPHLHFQLQNTPDVCFSLGLPVRFSNVIMEDIPDYERLDKRKPAVREPGFINRGMTVRNGE